jgi:hypothetical protein
MKRLLKFLWQLVVGALVLIAVVAVLSSPWLFLIWSEDHIWCRWVVGVPALLAIAWFIGRDIV